MPDQPGPESLIGPQNEQKNLARTLGVMIVSMVAIHYGGYALKNAAFKMMVDHGRDISLVRGRTTSLADDVIGLGKRLDDYSVKTLGQIQPGTTSMGSEFLLRAKARAAQQVKRTPFELVPAYMVDTYLRPETDTADGRMHDVKRMGELVGIYAAGDILVPAALRPLMRTQAARFAKENLQRVGPGMLSHMQEAATTAVVKGRSSMAAASAMYQQVDRYSEIGRASGLKDIWRIGKNVYRSQQTTIREEIEDLTEPALMQLMRSVSGHANTPAMRRTQARTMYMHHWGDRLTELAPHINRDEADALYHSLKIGVGNKSSRVVRLRDFERTGGGLRSVDQLRPGDYGKWWKRFGHDEESIKLNIYLARRMAPGLANMTDEQIEGLFKRTIQHADVSFDRAYNQRNLWIQPGSAGARNRRASAMGGIMAEREYQAAYRYARAHFGRISSPEQVDAIGTRGMTWGEYGGYLRGKAEVAGGTQQIRSKLAKYEEIQEQLRTFSRESTRVNRAGESQSLFDFFQTLRVDKALRVAPGSRGQTINLLGLREQAFRGLDAFERSWRIPILGFNPLQLAHWRARRGTPQLTARWLETGTYQPQLGGIVKTPTLAIGDRIFTWEESARRGRLVRGARLKMDPRRFKRYDLSSTATIGRLTRDVLGMGDDVIYKEKGYQGAILGNKFLRRKAPRVSNFIQRIARSLDISRDPSGSIPSAVGRWFRNAPAYWMYKRTGNRRWFNMMDSTNLPRVFEEVIHGAAGSEGDIVRALEQMSRFFHPGIAPRVLRDIREWAPDVYASRQAGIVKGLDRGRATVMQDFNSLDLIEDVVQGRRNLADIIEILLKDSDLRGGSELKQLYSRVIGPHERLLVGGATSPLARGLPRGAYDIAEYSIEDRVKRDIVNYLLVRPTTIGGTGNRPFIMQIAELEDILSRLPQGRYSKRIQSQVRGAIASMKLLAYKSTIADQGDRVAAIVGDRLMREEMQSLFSEWSKFGVGKGWRSLGPTSKFANVTVNKFGDKYAYVETFTSAFNRAPLGALAGVLGPGGQKTGASIGALHLVNRLSAVLNMVGLGFEPGSYRSASGMLFGGFFLRRILPAMAAVEGYRYLDWKSEQLTDKGVSERALEYGLVKPTIAGAAVGERIGVQSAARWFGKVTGEEDRMNLLKYATMDSADMQKFWEEGEVPIRRGRWWMLSATPFEGQRSMFYVPNVYRRTQARWKYTWEGGRGPEDFYFSRSWLPTPEYPLAPLRRITHPYEYEQATYNLRPYPLTGDFFTGPYGPLSPVLNATIGRFIKPTKRMHEEYWSGYTTGVHPLGGEPLEGVAWPIPPTSSFQGRGPSGLSGGRRMSITSGSGIAKAQLSLANSQTMGAAMSGWATPGAPYGIGAEAQALVMAQVGVSASVVAAATPPGIWTQPKPVSALGDMAYQSQEMAGIYGFGVQTLRQTFGAAGEYQSVSRIPRASNIYGFQSAFWGMELGGMGDIAFPGLPASVTFSEIFRRFVPRQPTSMDVNPIPNELWAQNRWLPGPYSGYFKDFSIGDPYAGSFGALRMPGEAFARAYGLHPDLERGEYPYGPIDRLRILSKVAPWSPEYKAYNRSLSHMNLTPEEQAAYQQIRGQVDDINTRYRFSPRRFSGIETEDRTYQVLSITPEGYIQARGLGTPIKLAGLEPGAQLSQALSSRLKQGQMVNIKYDVNRPRYTLDQEERVLEAEVGGLNQDLLAQGLQEEIGGSPLSYQARTNWLERQIGAAWEDITHSWNPITTKFIQRRTALEQYERTQVYGKDFAPWTHPYSSFIEPLINSVGAKGLFGSVATGLVAGLLMGRNPRAAIAFGAAGGVGLGAKKLRVEAEEAITGDAWIPGQVRERWEQEEYQDILQYVAAARQYSILRRRALAAGEPDPESLYQRDKELRSWIAKSKRNAAGSVLERSVWAGLAKNEYFGRHPLVAQAFSWRERMGQTLYGADLSGADLMSIQRAIPKERRMYFEQFLNAPEDERERILSLLPRLERRVYQSLWGMDVESKPTLTNYFSNRYLPPPEDAIWNPNVDWEKLRVRMVQRAGGNPSVYGYYPQEVMAAQLYPIPTPEMDMHNRENIKDQLQEIFADAGIAGLSIDMMPTKTPGLIMNVNVTRDMRDIVRDMVWARMDSI